MEGKTESDSLPDLILTETLFSSSSDTQPGLNQWEEFEPSLNQWEDFEESPFTQTEELKDEWGAEGNIVSIESKLGAFVCDWPPEAGLNQWKEFEDSQPTQNEELKDAWGAEGSIVSKLSKMDAFVRNWPPLSSSDEPQKSNNREKICHVARTLCDFLECADRDEKRGRRDTKFQNGNASTSESLALLMEEITVITDPVPDLVKNLDVEIVEESYKNMPLVLLDLTSWIFLVMVVTLLFSISLKSAAFFIFLSQCRMNTPRSTDDDFAQEGLRQHPSIKPGPRCFLV